MYTNMSAFLVLWLWIDSRCESGSNLDKHSYEICDLCVDLRGQ